MRRLVLEEGFRADGRSISDVRPIWSRAGLLPRTHGSVLFTRGETQVRCAMTQWCCRSCVICCSAAAAAAAAASRHTRTCSLPNTPAPAALLRCAGAGGDHAGLQPLSAAHRHDG